MVNGMNSFEIINETEENIKELEEIKKLVEFALNYKQIQNSIFNIIIVDEEKIQDINRDYRNKNSVTDVVGEKIKKLHQNNQHKFHIPTCQREIEES